MTRPIGWVQNFVVEHGEVEGQAQPNWMGRLHFSFGYIKRLLIALLRALHGSLRGEKKNKKMSSIKMRKINFLREMAIGRFDR